VRDREDKRDARRLEQQALSFSKDMEINCRRSENRRKAEVGGKIPYERRGRMQAASRSILVGMIAMLTASLANLPEAEGFKAYYCSNSSNPAEMYSLLDPEPCPDVALDHVVEIVLHGEIVQMKRERLVQITRCHVVESVLSQYCGWKSRAGVVRYLKFREPYMVEPAACRHANKTGMLAIHKKSYAVHMDTVKSYTDFTRAAWTQGTTDRWGLTLTGRSSWSGRSPRQSWKCLSEWNGHV
jgi:hypothetical protein